jgi:hypothetical protein
MFPARDSQGRGTINLAQRPWNQPLRRRGFVLTGHQGPSLTLLRRAYDDFQLDAELQLRGEAEILLDYGAPLEPSAPSSDATLHALMRTRHTALALAPGAWRLAQRDAAGKETVVASARLPAAEHFAVRLARRSGLLSVDVNRHTLWSGPLPVGPAHESTGVLGLRVGTNTHLRVSKFAIRGTARPAQFSFGANEALLGAAQPAAEWQPRRDPLFRFGNGVVSRKPTARAKWNVAGNRLRLWSPRGPEFGEVEVRLDGKVAAVLDLRSDRAEASRVIWESSNLEDGFHALALTTRNGRLPVDSLDVSSGARG